MKTHTTGFKNAEKELGRQLRAVITYGNVTLEEEIYSITPHYNADLLKSVMKQLDLELSVDIPLETVLNCRIGILVNGSYEMLNYGNYVVYKSEKQEDTNTYKLTCYDKILYSMKQNEQLNITYPISIKNYLNAIANKLGLTVSTTTFYNESMMIQDELYLGLEYTYRDILDEIAQVTGSIICLNENDEILVKYPTQTNDIIDEEFLKDVNVEFGQKYGVINSIVLSRSGESDNVYLRDEESVAQNGLTEVKIVDNQIMNFNDRSDYLPGILNALNGLYYYINDFSSTGILYYDVGDLYNIQIGQNTYQCLMLNDEIDITTGIEEIIHTDLPEQSETDYTKADKTDMKINKAYIIVDKQNQIIDSVVNNVTEQNNKISQITQTVDEINSKIQDITDITTYGESDRAEVELTDINESEPIRIKVHPTSANISYLYPKETLYPSSNLYIATRIIRFTRTYEEDEETFIENIDYLLPDDLLRYSDTVYDEFYLDYDSQTCQIIKRCAYNEDGTVRALGTEITTDYEYPTITLGDGNYKISLPGYNLGYIYARLMTKNIYTTQFYTKVETDSRINQKADEINLGVNQTFTRYSTTDEMNSAITLKANEITSTVSNVYETKDNAQSNYSQLQQTTNNISSVVTTKVGEDEIISKINQSSEAVTIDADKISLNGKTINLTSDDISIASTNFNVNKNGKTTIIDTTAGSAEGSKDANFTIKNADDTLRTEIIPNRAMISGFTSKAYLWCSNSWAYIGAVSDSGTSKCRMVSAGADLVFIDCTDGIDTTTIRPNGITTPTVVQTSLESEKKNFEKFSNALQILKNIDIYKYNLKSEEDNAKKHIGFVIGDNFNYIEEVTSKNNDGVDTYSFVSLCCKAIQEQQEQIEELKEENKKKDEIISKLIERVEKLERKEIKNELYKDDLGE